MDRSHSPKLHLNHFEPEDLPLLDVRQYSAWGRAGNPAETHEPGIIGFPFADARVEEGGEEGENVPQSSKISCAVRSLESRQSRPRVEKVGEIEVQLYKSSLF